MSLSMRIFVPVLFLAGLAVLPLVANAFDQPYYVGLASRMLILAIGASSLNLILGYGGMVSFGHAVYIGIGGYAVGILTFHAVENGFDWMGSGFIQFPVAMVASALVALFIGSISLRTRGVYFIMITLAFSQMFYFVAVGAEKYGADDGLSLYFRSEFGGLISLDNPFTFYYFVLAILLVVLVILSRLVNSRFGMVIRAIKSNERRIAAIGIPIYRYKLTCFIIAGVIAGLAGALLANRTDFISPSMMHWTRSGDFIIMIVLGGMGTLMGPLYGAVALLFLEEVLSGYTEYWQLFFGPLLILIVLFGRGGIQGLINWLLPAGENKRA